MKHYGQTIYIHTSCIGRSHSNIQLSQQTLQHSKKFFSHSKESKTQNFEDLSEYLHGRKRNERRDSVTKEILLERKNHQKRFENIAIDLSRVRQLDKLGLGSRKRRNYEIDRFSRRTRDVVPSLSLDMKASMSAMKLTQTDVGAGGFSHHLTSAAENWPVFTHVLPEIVFAGHTNSGKSTLVNIVSGLAARKGPARVSDRAGWTDQICFYQLGKRPPVLILADTPGYGHAIASSTEMSHWNTMIKNYLSTRKVISLCCILVDCTRGLCSRDKQLIQLCVKYDIKWRVVLTKCDLLKSSTQVMQSIGVVESDLIQLLNNNNQKSASSEANKNTDHTTTTTATSNKNDNNNDNVNHIHTNDDSLVADIISNTHNHNKNIDIDINDNHHQLDSDVQTVVDEDEIDWEYDHTYDDDQQQHHLHFNNNANNASNASNSNILHSFHDNHNTDNESNDISDHVLSELIIPISATKGAGIRQLWRTMSQNAYLHTFPPQYRKTIQAESKLLQMWDLTDNRVREHYKAHKLRQNNHSVILNQKLILNNSNTINTDAMNNLTTDSYTEETNNNNNSSIINQFNPNRTNNNIIQKIKNKNKLIATSKLPLVKRFDFRMK